MRSEALLPKSVEFSAITLGRPPGSGFANKYGYVGFGFDTGGVINHAFSGNRRSNSLVDDPHHFEYPVAMFDAGTDPVADPHGG